MIQQIKNRTEENLRPGRYIKMLTLKIENLSDTVIKQHQYIKSMQNQFNKKLTKIVHFTMKGSQLDGSSGLVTDDDMEENGSAGESTKKPGSKENSHY